jgi:phosphinothricin acetyltransferase
VEELRARPAVRDDLPGLTEIYNHYIAHTSTTFATQTLLPDERQAWFEEHAGGRYRIWVLAPEGGAPVGWAESGKFRPRAAYDTTIEVSVYLAPGLVGRGLGSRLYHALFASIAGENLHRAVAVIALPNPVSVAFHARWGFREVGRLPEVGWKLGRYWDVGIFVRPLGPGEPARPAPETLIQSPPSSPSQGELGTG